MTQQVVTILPSEVQERLEKGEKLVMIDVREYEEVAAGMIPGAVQIRLSEIPDRLDEINRNVETIMICRSGGRSGKACEFLIAQGFQNVKSMAGGMLAWQGPVKSEE